MKVSRTNKNYTLGNSSLKPSFEANLSLVHNNSHLKIKNKNIRRFFSSEGLEKSVLENYIKKILNINEKLKEVGGETIAVQIKKSDVDKKSLLISVIKGRVTMSSLYEMIGNFDRKIISFVMRTNSQLERLGVKI